MNTPNTHYDLILILRAVLVLLSLLTVFEQLLLID